MNSLDKVLQNHQRVVEDGFTATGGLKYRSYAVSTLRGGVGKSTITFNLAYELAQQRSLLIADMCAQCNLTENLMREENPEITVLETLQPILLGPAFGSAPPDASYRVSNYCNSFKTAKPSFLMPGNAELFAFPSMLYQQLQTAHAQALPVPVQVRLCHPRQQLVALEDVAVSSSEKVSGDKFLADASSTSSWSARCLSGRPACVCRSSLCRSAPCRGRGPCGRPARRRPPAAATSGSWRAPQELMRPSKLRLPLSTDATTDPLRDAFETSSGQRAGVADASGAAVAHHVELQLLEYGSRPELE